MVASTVLGQQGLVCSHSYQHAVTYIVLTLVWLYSALWVWLYAAFSAAGAAVFAVPRASRTSQLVAFSCCGVFVSCAQIQNVTLKQLPQLLQDETRLGRLLRQLPGSSTPPGVWTILLWPWHR
jgi:hypothetical protein